MTERPILFSAPMVRALLNGTKTQTRRALRGFCPPNRPEYDSESGRLEWFNGDEVVVSMRCPYGAPGDRLWVRETWAPHFMYESVRPAGITIDARSCLFYAADGGITGGCEPTQRARKWRPAIHMPRAASRIALEVTGVRVERLQEISEADALAEGAPPSHPSINRVSREFGYPDFPRSWYAQLWDQINGPGAWGANPWVWAITFRRV